MKCNHKFKIIEDKIVSYRTLFGRNEHWHIYTSQCEKCGELKHYRHSLGDSYTDLKDYAIRGKED